MPRCAAAPRNHENGVSDGYARGLARLDQVGIQLVPLEPECQSGPDIAAYPKLWPPTGEST
jgi:hypothetical protein